MSDEPVLSFVDLDGWCYFTPPPLSDAEGDDWDDAPYDGNAGPPYDFTVMVNVVSGHLMAPEDYWGTPLTVEQINANPETLPWFRNWSRWDVPPPIEKCVRVPAGTPLSDFKRLVWSAGGRIYSEELPPESGNG